MSLVLRRRSDFLPAARALLDIRVVPPCCGAVVPVALCFGGGGCITLHVDLRRRLNYNRGRVIRSRVVRGIVVIRPGSPVRRPAEVKTDKHAWTTAVRERGLADRRPDEKRRE